MCRFNWVEENSQALGLKINNGGLIPVGRVPSKGGRPVFKGVLRPGAVQLRANPAGLEKQEQVWWQCLQGLLKNLFVNGYCIWLGLYRSFSKVVTDGRN